MHRRARLFIAAVFSLGGVVPLVSGTAAGAAGAASPPAGIPIPQGPTAGVQVAPGVVLGADGWTYFTNALAARGVSPTAAQTFTHQFVQGTVLPGGGCSYQLSGPPVPTGAEGLVIATATYPQKCVADVASGSIAAAAAAATSPQPALTLGWVYAYAKGFEEDPATITVSGAIANITAWDPYGTSITSPSGYPHWLEYWDGWSLQNSYAWVGETGPSQVSYGADSTSYNAFFKQAMEALLGTALADLLCGSASATTTTDYAMVYVTAQGSITASAQNTATGACTSLLSPELAYGSGQE